jgi:fibronectin type 3 domain-containing protein
VKTCRPLIDRSLLLSLLLPFILLAGCASTQSVSRAPSDPPPQPAIPAVPTGLQAIAGDTQVTLAWTPSARATSYHVKRATTSGGPYFQISAPTSAAYIDTTATNGTTYYYEVSAVNSAGESANSAQASSTPTAPLQIPSVPIGLAATAANAQVSLTWSAVTGATSYHVKRATTFGGPYTQIAAPTSANYTDATASNNTTYYYVVSAVNSAGESASSAQVSATPTAAIQIPNVPTGLAATAGNAQVSLSWSTTAGATGYHVKRATTSGGPYTQIAALTSANYTDSAAVNGTTYYYVVSAVNSAGESANSIPSSATPSAPIPSPSIPTGLAATAGNAQVSLTWSATTGATSYHVKRSINSGGPYTQIAAPTASNFTDTTTANGTTYYYVVSAVNSVGESANSEQASATPTAPSRPDVTITIDPTKTHAISPYIYGLNFYSGVTGAPPHLTFDRAGGNRWTAYNWETNASNAGSDYLYENDAYLSSSTTPAEAVRNFIAQDQANGLASLVTFQLQGLVSADESGPVSIANPPDLTRFKQVVYKKSTQSTAAFTITPPTTDADVYMDEFLWALDQKFSGQSIFGANPTTHPTFVQLDNEPELWNSTHLEVQGSTGVTSDTYISKTISLTKALKDQFPNVVIFGPVHYGFEGIYNWQGELSATPSGSNWFPDKYLPAIKTASTTYGKPLVDVYDFHWYSEATDGSTRVTDLTGTTLTDAQVQAIVQSPRSLWDTTYKENSWITNDVLGGPIYILGRLQSRIAAENPGMKISITEYNNGGSQHIAGTIAQADNLGIFGVQALFAASLWPLTSNEPYTLAAFRAFREFDGANSSFGDTSLQSTSSNVQDVVVYASTDTSTPGRVVFVAINRSTSPQVTAINGQPLSGTAHLYQMTATTAQGQSSIQPVSVGTLPASGSSLTTTLPPLSVTTIDIF